MVTNRTYLVTGTSGGIGLELVRQLSERGDVVYACCRSRKTSATGTDNLSALEGERVKIVEGIDVTKDDVGDTLKEKLAGVTFDVVIHNAGGLNTRRQPQVDAKTLFGSQNLDAIEMDTMRECFELNTLSVLRVHQALAPQIASPGGKVMIISTGMASIADNTSGGVYAYRASKAAVNMVGKGMSCDLKDKGIAVVCANPNMVVTDFGPGQETMKKFGGMAVEDSVTGLLQIEGDLSMETTGKYMTVPKDFPEKRAVKEFPAGW